MHKFFGLSISAAFLVSLAPFALAQSTTITVNGTQGPWLPSLNPSFNYGSNNNLAPAVVSASSGVSFAPGGTLTVTYVSGQVNVFPEGGFPATDANGDSADPTNTTVIAGYGSYPSYFMNPSSYPVYASELVGAFANNGVIVGTPFPIGDGPVNLTIPAGASQLLLGVDDNDYSDNVGSWNISVSSAAPVITGPSTTVTVNSTQGPWQQTLNPNFNYGSDDTSYFMDPSSYPVYASELVGTFANDGVIVGSPFPIGDGPANFTIPAGANQLLLGVDDNDYADNVGSWQISVSYPPLLLTSVKNGASFKPGIVANSLASIFGTNLTTFTDTWDNFIVNGQFPSMLDDVTVTVGGQLAYPNYISPAQINIVVPDVGSGPQDVIVTNSMGSSVAFTATVNAFGPAFFAWPNNQVVATRQDFSLAAQAGTFPGVSTVPAAPGDVIILWGVGFGPTNPAAPTGVETPSDQLYSASTLPTVTVNNIPAEVYGAALAPGYAPLYQVAIQVPTSLTDGNWPVVASVGGVSSPVGLVLTVQQ
ncbi:MAG: hypothetical protein ABSB86_09380 [Bryobacteraceae bacterium]